MGADDLNEEKMDELLKLMRAVVPDISDMTDAGKVGFVYKFDYDPGTTYEKLDVVKFGMSLWTPKTETTGNPPPDQSQEGQENTQENEHWVLFLPGALGSDYVKKTDISRAPTETRAGKPGINFPDGKTIRIDEATGMMKGAPPGKELTQEEMEEQLASGELEDGDVVYLSGPASGENGLLVKVDSELKDSVNPVQNKVIKNALDRLDSLIEETNALRASLEQYGMAMISQSSSVTETEGLVLGAIEKNASIPGTLARNILEAKNFMPGVLGNVKIKNISKTLSERKWTDFASFRVSEDSVIFASVNCTCPAVSSGATFGGMIFCSGSALFSIAEQSVPSAADQSISNVALPASVVPAGTTIVIRALPPKANSVINISIYSNAEFLEL